jgi:hypothetical protein
MGFNSGFKGLSMGRQYLHSPAAYVSCTGKPLPIHCDSSAITLNIANRKLTAMQEI